MIGNKSLIVSGHLIGLSYLVSLPLKYGFSDASAFLLFFLPIFAILRVLLLDQDLSLNVLGVTALAGMRSLQRVLLAGLNHSLEYILFFIY